MIWMVSISAFGFGLLLGMMIAGAWNISYEQPGGIKIRARTVGEVLALLDGACKIGAGAQASQVLIRSVETGKSQPRAM